MSPDLLSQAANEIRKASNLLIACHVRPDCDALGSLLALGLGCEAIGAPVTMVSADGVPAAYRFLPHSERVVTTARGVADVAVGVDADGSARLGSAEAAVLAAPVVIDIDHHTGPAPYGNLVLVDPHAAATGEIILELLDALRAPLTREIAICLMAAVLTDTGSFRFSNVTPETMRMAARLIEAGAEPGPIYQAVYEQKSVPALRLAGFALEGLRTERGGELVWAALSQVEFAAAGASDEDTDGIVGHLQGAGGARVAMLLREQAGGEVRVSLRARDATDVAAVARRFGGGGHHAASGCTLPGPLPVAARRLVEAALAALDG
jgi:bifunctional oligoribonuclease and PAP phosphatase NrnA